MASKCWSVTKMLDVLDYNITFQNIEFQFSTMHLLYIKHKCLRVQYIYIKDK